MALSWRNLTITEAQHIQLFTTGLGALLRNDVTLQWPQTIDDAVIYTKAYKQRLTMQVSVPSTVLTRQPGLPQVIQPDGSHFRRLRQNHLRNEGFIASRSIERYSTKRECIKHTYELYKILIKIEIKVLQL
jgi:hypothetical protein